MEHPHTPSTITPDRPFRIHPAVWLIVAGLVAALAAIFVFKVAVGTVISYGFIGLMALSHLFMHGGHGSHGGHGAEPQGREAKANADGSASETPSESNDERAGHSGGCH